MDITLANDQIKAAVFGEENFKINQEMLSKISSSGEPYCSGMLVELFTDCNLRCPLCPCPPWQTDRFKQALTPDDAKRIIDESMKYVPRYNLNFASEPLLSPHIPEIVGHIHSQKRLSWMYTNAMMLTEDTAYKIFDAHLDFVRFAVDGLDADCHEFYRRGSDFNTVFENVMRFIKIKNENKLTHPYIQVFTLRHRLNYKKEAEYYDFWSQHLGINGVNEFLMYMPNLNETKRIDGKDRDELLQIFPEDFEATRYVKKSDTEIVARDVKRKCYSPVYPCIGSNGDVVVCCQDPFAKHVMGNIFEASFEEIWLSDKAARMRKMAEEMAFPMCKVCNLRGM